VADIPASGQHVALAADANTRAAIASRAGLRSLERLDASFDLFPYRAGGVHVLGQVRAMAGQTCVVTLEPMQSEIEESVDLLFVPGGSRADRENDVDMRAGDQTEGPEPLANGEIDLGAIATEFLILGIDPYPRCAGAVFEAPASAEAPDNPFAQLAALKAKSGTKDR
jgi:hypothetical protein